MKSRLQRILQTSTFDMWISTFHAMGVKILRMFGDRIGIDKHFQIIDDEDVTQLIKALIKETNLSLEMIKPKQLKNHIMMLKSEQKTLLDYEYPLKDALEVVYPLYQARLKKNHLLDFEDLINRVIELLKKDADVKYHFNQMFQYVLVDEFQDTNHRQYELIKLLVGDHRNVFIVGDEDQSIYAFRGANILNIKKFIEDFQPESIILDENYRSTQTILNAANQIIKGNKNRIEKNLFSRSRKGEKIVFFKGQNNFDETQFVVDQIKAHHDEGIPYESMAILYRANATSRSFEQGLSGRKIPYRIIGNLSFYKRKEIKDIIAYLRLMMNPYDDVSFERIINEPKRGLGDKTIEAFKRFAIEHDLSYYEALTHDSNISPKANKTLLEFHHTLEYLKTYFSENPFYLFVEEWLDKTGYQTMLNTDPLGEMRKENILELVGYFEEVRKMYVDLSKTETLMAMLEDIALRSAEDENKTDQGVSLMTLHGAKGLEFDVVFMVALEQGMFPLRQTLESTFELEEERRLMYVGITRAKKHLYLTNVSERFIHGEYQHLLNSQFIEAIDPEILELKGHHQAIFKTTQRIEHEYRETKLFKAKKQAYLERTENDLSHGDKVIHTTFGEGVVIRVENDQCQIAFDKRFGIKTLMKDHPAIKKVNHGREATD
jgi:DNA helicase II / ATP-dependent DNA helicase PcrA